MAAPDTRSEDTRSGAPAAPIADLPAADRAHLTVRSDAAGLRRLAAHGGLILLVGVLIGLRAPLWPLLLPVQGVLVVFLFTMVHECTHETPFRSRRLSEWAGRIGGFALLLPFTWFRYFHLAHHRHTNDPQRDPELLAGAEPRTWAAFALHVSGLPYWTGQARQLWINAFATPSAAWLPRRVVPRLRREARAMLAGYALVLASLALTPLLLWVWLLPVLLGQPVLRLYLLAEHGRCPRVADVLDNTRTTYTNRLVRFLAWNMPYHTEHHAFPAVPFHRLPALHRRMRAHLRTTAPGYGAFTRDYVATLHRDG